MQRMEHGVCHTLHAGRMELSVTVAGGGSGGLDVIQDALRAYCSSKGNRPHGQRVLEQALYKNEILVKTYKWCW